MLSKSEEISLLLREFLMYHRINHQRFLEDLDLYYGQPILLMHLYDKGEATQKELAGYLNCSPAAVAVSIKRLERKGLLEKRVDNTDMRYNKITLTEEGKKRALAARAGLDRIDRRCFDGFLQDELDTLKNFYQRMINNLNSEGKQ